MGIGMWLVVWFCREPLGLWLRGEDMQGVQGIPANAITVHDGRLYVVVWRYILVYSPDGVLWQRVELPDRKICSSDLFQVCYWSPRSICVDGKHVYVQDYKRVYILNVVQPSSAAGSSSS